MLFLASKLLPSLSRLCSVLKMVIFVFTAILPQPRPFNFLPTKSAMSPKETLLQPLLRSRSVNPSIRCDRHHTNSEQCTNGSLAVSGSIGSVERSWAYGAVPVFTAYMESIPFRHVGRVSQSWSISAQCRHLISTERTAFPDIKTFSVNEHC